MKRDPASITPVGFQNVRRLEGLKVEKLPGEETRPLFLLFKKSFADLIFGSCALISLSSLCFSMTGSIDELSDLDVVNGGCGIIFRSDNEILVHWELP
jgi:hypothetical protein